MQETKGTAKELTLRKRIEMIDPLLIEDRENIILPDQLLNDSCGCVLIDCS